MRPLVESIHSLRLTHVDDHGHDRLSSHGPAVAVRDRLLVSDPDGRMFDVVGLPHQPVLVLYGDLGYNFSPDLSSFSRNAAQTHALAKAWCRQTRCVVFRLFSEEKRTWTTLAAPPPGCDGAPLTDAVLGAWVGDEIVVFSVRPRFGRILPEALFWSRYNRDGEMIAGKQLLLASERGWRSFTERDVFWSAAAGNRVIAYAWNRFFALDGAGVTELPAPRGVGPVQAHAPSGVRDGSILLFSHTDAHDEAFLYDIDLMDWSSSRQDVSALLRGPRGSSARWMPAQVNVVPLRDDWVLLDTHDGDPLNRVACWLWERSTNRAWSVPMKDVGGRYGLAFDYVASCDRFIASDRNEIAVSRAFEEIVRDLRAAPVKAKILPGPIVGPDSSSDGLP